MLTRHSMLMLLISPVTAGHQACKLLSRNRCSPSQRPIKRAKRAMTLIQHAMLRSPILLNHCRLPCVRVPVEKPLQSIPETNKEGEEGADASTHSPKKKRNAVAAGEADPALVSRNKPNVKITETAQLAGPGRDVLKYSPSSILCF